MYSAFLFLIPVFFLYSTTKPNSVQSSPVPDNSGAGLLVFKAMGYFPILLTHPKMLSNWLMIIWMMDWRLTGVRTV